MNRDRLTLFADHEMSLLPRVAPYAGRHHIDQVPMSAPPETILAAREARRLIHARMNEMRREARP